MDVIESLSIWVRKMFCVTTRLLGQRFAPSLTVGLLPRHPEALAHMTSAAVLEIQIATEGSAAVMTRRARIVAGREVLGRSRGAHLSPLRQSGRVAVTIGTIQTLARAVLRVTERIAERDGSGRSSRVCFLIVASFA